MPAAGAGPSRRSHTKSRKGCKTCKRRHIRCDETFPQCRNCTKHQCRCDYMDGPAITEDPAAQPVVPGITWTPEMEHTVQAWEQSGEACLGSYSIDLHAQGHRYSRADLQLIYYMLLSGQSPETREFTVWTSTTAQTLAAARSKPFLVHAILAFTALSLAWETNSPEAKAIAYRHGGVALEGLQQAIASFSRDNSDAVLLASVLLSWQANDWRSWVSLTSGIRTVVNSMQPFKHDSPICHVVDEQEAAIPESFPSMLRAPVDDDFHNNYVVSLQHMLTALDTVEPYYQGRPEADAFCQLAEYLHQLQAASPAETPQEQFNHLYHFRKFLFWIPASALKSASRDYATLLSLAYLYCIALQMEPLFPNVAAAFCSRIALQPLDEIFDAFDHLHRTSKPGDEQVHQMLLLLQYPRGIVATYHNARSVRDAQVQGMRRATPNFDAFSGDLASSIEAQHVAGNALHSPAFGAGDAPARSASIHSFATATTSTSQHSSPYLELPETMQHAVVAGSVVDAVPASHQHQQHQQHQQQQQHLQHHPHSLRFASVPLQQTDDAAAAGYHHQLQSDYRYASAGPASAPLSSSMPTAFDVDVAAAAAAAAAATHPLHVDALGLGAGSRLSLDGATAFADPVGTMYTHARAGSEGHMAPLRLDHESLDTRWQHPAPAPAARSPAAEARLRAAQGF